MIQKYIKIKDIEIPINIKNYKKTKRVLHKYDNVLYNYTEVKEKINNE